MGVLLSGRALGLALLGAFSSGILVAYWLLKGVENKPDKICDYQIARVGGYEWVGPLLYAEKECETETYHDLKIALSRQIDSLQRSKCLSEASVYLRDFYRGEWMSLNEEERYHPASLMKVALLTSMLKAAERQPGLLEQRLLYTPPAKGTVPPQYFVYDHIEAGKEYTVAELMEYMIVYSDNYATWLLASRLNPQSTPKLFADIGLSVPTEDPSRLTMSAPEVAVLFKAIFNSSYLSPESSEYAARLMSRCAFKEGFRRGLPPDTRLWHKFGEWRSPQQPCELHEAGVLYVEGAPYLLVIMTRGNAPEPLAQSIAAMSRLIYQNLLARNPGSGLGEVENAAAAP